MLTIPSFLLRRLYVRGSLCNTEHGVQFQLTNKLGSGYAKRVLPLALDGKAIPLEHCLFSVNGNQLSFDTVTSEMPFTLELNRTTTITIKGVFLNGEAHTIGFGFEVAGLGLMQFDFTDVPSNE